MLNGQHSHFWSQMVLQYDTSTIARSTVLVICDRRYQVLRTPSTWYSTWYDSTSVYRMYCVLYYYGSNIIHGTTPYRLSYREYTRTRIIPGLYRICTTQDWNIEHGHTCSRSTPYIIGHFGARFLLRETFTQMCLHANIFPGIALEYPQRIGNLQNTWGTINLYDTRYRQYLKRVHCTVLGPSCL